MASWLKKKPCLTTGLHHLSTFNSVLPIRMFSTILTPATLGTFFSPLAMVFSLKISGRYFLSLFLGKQIFQLHTYQYNHLYKLHTFHLRVQLNPQFDSTTESPPKHLFFVLTFVITLFFIFFFDYLKYLHMFHIHFLTPSNIYIIVYIQTRRLEYIITPIA